MTWLPWQELWVKKLVALQLLDEMADIEAFLGAMMDARTIQGGATTDTEAGSRETPAALVGSYPDEKRKMKPLRRMSTPLE